MNKPNTKALVATSLLAVTLSGCSIMPSSSSNSDIKALMQQLNNCSYDEPTRKHMYQVTGKGNKVPFPLLWCEGLRSDKFQERWLASRQTSQYQILGKVFLPPDPVNGYHYGAALIRITTPDWGKLCDQNVDWQGDKCNYLIFGVNAPQFPRLDKSQQEYLLNEQDKLALVTDVPTMTDTILMPLKRTANGKLEANWVWDAGAADAAKALADKLGEDAGKLRVQAYDQNTDLLAQDDLPANYQGVFFYATPQHIDYVSRPASQYAIPLFKGVKVRGYKVEIYKAYPKS